MREIKHLSVHQWLLSAIPDSQQPSSPIGFLFLKLPPPPCAVLLESYNGRTLGAGYGNLKGPGLKPPKDPKATKLRVQEHCAGVAHFLLCFHPDDHALPLWLTRFIQQLSCQVPGQRTWKQCVSHCADFIWSTQVLGPGHARKLALTVQSKHASDGSACVHTKSIQLQAKQTNATRCYQPPSASPASVESKRRMWRQRWPILGCNRPRARRTPPWLDLGWFICKHWRCAHPKIEPKLWAMWRLRKVHSPRLPPRGLSIQHPSYACCGNCCRSALLRLASHRALFSRYILLVRIVCSGH